MPSGRGWSGPSGGPRCQEVRADPRQVQGWGTAYGSHVPPADISSFRVSRRQGSGVGPSPSRLLLQFADRMGSDAGPWPLAPACPLLPVLAGTSRQHRGLGSRQTHYWPDTTRYRTARRGPRGRGQAGPRGLPGAKSRRWSEDRVSRGWACECLSPRIARGGKVLIRTEMKLRWKRNSSSVIYLKQGKRAQKLNSGDGAECM